jgi:hypothetical protein
MSTPSRKRGDSVLHASRSRRRARFRPTAFPTPRPHTKPARGPDSPGRTYSNTSFPGARRPPSTTSRNCARRRRVPPRGPSADREASVIVGGAFTGTGELKLRCCSGPWPAAAPGSAGRPESACECEIHGSSCAFGCSADRSSSPRHSPPCTHGAFGRSPAGALAKTDRVYRPMRAGPPNRFQWTVTVFGWICPNPGKVVNNASALASRGRPGAILRSTFGRFPLPVPVPPEAEAVFPQLWKAVVDKW